MKKETFMRALQINDKITETKGVIAMLKRSNGVYIGDDYSNGYVITTELKEKILPICKEYLKELEKEFKEL